MLNFWGSWCAPCRVETPEFEQVYRATNATGVDVPRRQREGPTSSSRAPSSSGSDQLPVALRPARRGGPGVPGLPGERDPVHHRVRPPGPGGRRLPERGGTGGPASRWSTRLEARVTRRTVGETFSRLVTDGPLLVAAGVGGAGRADQLPLARACCRWCRATSPTSPAWPAPDAPADRAAARGDATAVRTAVSPRSRVVPGAVLFVARLHGGLRRLRGALRPARRGCCCSTADCSDRMFGVVMILLGLAFLGLLPGCSASCADPPAAGGRAGRRTAARHRLRARLDAVHRADARRGVLAGVHAGQRDPRRAPRGSPTASGLGIPFVLVALGARWLLGALDRGAPARRHGHPGRRRAARAGRPAAAHRAAGPS